MGTRPRSRYAESSTDQLSAIIADALAPLTTEVKEMRKELGELELRTIPRAEVYDRQVMDEKLGQLRADNTSIRNEIKSMKEFVWKALGGASAVVVIFVYLHQYVSIK